MTIAQKLKIKPGAVLRTLHAPSGFAAALQPPADVKISATAKDPDQVHWFVKDRAQMEKELDTVLALAKDDVLCWIYYPKGSSGIQTDLTRDKGWDSLRRHQEMQWISLISFDETWSAFGMRRQKASDRKKGTEKQPRAIFDYVDPVKKTVRVPEDLALALADAGKEAELFHSLAFSHRKEYVEWIVSAKRDETRKQRIQGTIERLSKGWKNPANR